MGSAWPIGSAACNSVAPNDDDGVGRAGVGEGPETPGVVKRSNRDGDGCAAVDGESAWSGWTATD